MPRGCLRQWALADLTPIDVTGWEQTFLNRWMEAIQAKPLAKVVHREIVLMAGNRPGRIQLLQTIWTIKSESTKIPELGSTNPERRRRSDFARSMRTSMIRMYDSVTEM